jgi:L,D-transpeptidase ErfK/SrfK
MGWVWGRAAAICGLALGIGPFGCARPVREPALRRPAAPNTASRRSLPPALGRESEDARPAAPTPRLVYLRLDLSDRRVYVVRADAPAGGAAVVDAYPVAIGKPGYETPTGRFVVTEKILDPEFTLYDDWDQPSQVVRRFDPGPDNPLGVRWIGFASVEGLGIGFHGTPRPELLGQAVSHGCVRMHNRDVIRLYDQVAIGTTVVVEP